MNDTQMPKEVTKAISNILQFLEKSEADFVENKLILFPCQKKKKMRPAAPTTPHFFLQE